MRFMIIVKATKDSEAGVMPEESLIAEMAKYHEELQKAGFAKLISLGRLPPDDDCAKSVLFFVSDYSRVITGTSIDINGGEYMG